MRPLNEQRVLITGSTDGLGRRLADVLAQRGAALIVHGRDPAKVERVCRETGAAGGLTADLARLDAVRAVAGEVGELDTLVNNAGVIVPERSESEDGYELTFAVNPPRALPAHAATAATHARAGADRERVIYRPSADRLLRRHARVRLRPLPRVRAEQALADHVHDRAGRATRRP